jgi:hypothetical protein
VGKQGIDTGKGAEKMTLYATYWEGRGQNIFGERKQRKMLQVAKDIKNVFLGAKRWYIVSVLRHCNARIIFTQMHF